MKKTATKCASCGGSMKKGGTKKPIMRGGGKVATKATASFPSVSTGSGVGAKVKSMASKLMTRKKK